jgi:hypothetical protein
MKANWGRKGGSKLRAEILWHTTDGIHGQSRGNPSRLIRWSLRSQQKEHGSAQMSCSFPEPDSQLVNVMRSTRRLNGTA